jgi:hypothetical protein
MTSLSLKAMRLMNEGRRFSAVSAMIFGQPEIVDAQESSGSSATIVPFFKSR